MKRSSARLFPAFCPQTLVQSFEAISNTVAQVLEVGFGFLDPQGTDLLIGAVRPGNSGILIWSVSPMFPVQSLWHRSHAREVIVALNLAHLWLARGAARVRARSG